MTNKERYAQLCKEEPSICLYDQPWWMDAVCGADNWDVLLYEKNGQIIGAMPYYVKQKFGLKYITQPEFTQHNGAWIKYPENQSQMKRLSFEKEVLGNLIAQMEACPVCYYQQQFSPNLTNWLPFYWKGYSQSTNYTYRLPDIHDTNAIFENFYRDERKLLRRIMKKDFALGADLPAEQFYEYHKKCLAERGQSIGHSYELFERIYTAAYEHNQGKSMYLVDESGNILGATFNVWDSMWGYDLIGAVPHNANSKGVMDLLLFRMIEYLSDKVPGYDFEGSMIEGVEEFNRYFNAIQTPYFCIHKIHTKNPVVRAMIQHKLS